MAFRIPNAEKPGRDVMAPLVHNVFADPGLDRVNDSHAPKNEY